MTKSYPLAIHIFRRDLRLQDNTALIDALKLSERVLPCFIFDKRQIELNDYKSDNCIEFMLNSLQQLNVELQKYGSKLYIFYGIAEEVIEKLIHATKAQAVFINRDYTPFSCERDKKIANSCKKLDIDFHSYADALLHEPEQVLKPNKQPYTIFTPYFHKASQFDVQRPLKNSMSNYYQGDCALEDKHIFAKLAKKKNINLFPKGGHEEAIHLLKQIKKMANYKEQRDIPALDSTTKLSAHNKFGTISIRELHALVKETFGPQHTLITEMYWRDFFTHIGFHFPHVFHGAFHQKYDKLQWSKNEKHFRAWCDGRTGFPIVDAGMRELNITGYMHNRVRMIVASFLTKDLHINWRWGEKYFAQQLVDYDPAVNNGNWQWAASTGCDAQPYFRIFNPWLQQQKFDPDCLYIKKWIPELALIPSKTIHTLNTNKQILMTNYPEPIIDHAIESAKAKLMYKEV